MRGNRKKEYDKKVTGKTDERTAHGIIIQGNILYMEDIRTLQSVDNGYLVVEDGRILGVYKEFPREYAGWPVENYGDRLIIPGMTDLHIHAPQYPIGGLGTDKELLEWLDSYIFPEEKKYASLQYAREAYDLFTEQLLKSVTTRACIFGTVHKEATFYLASKLDAAGFPAYVGKVNMDRNCPDGLAERTEDSLKDTQWYVREVSDKCTYVKPMITPRFVPSCTDGLMRGLSALRQKYDVPVQSHLSENPAESAWVAELNPASRNYGDAYDMFGLLGGDYKAVMAHCVYSSAKEQAALKKNGVYIAHCAASNTNLASGIAPIRKYLDNGLKVGLGTDVAGGPSLSMLRAIQDTVAVSKLYWRLVDAQSRPLSVWEAFYLATMGGGSFFGKTGSFLAGFDADIVVLDDTPLQARRVQECFSPKEPSPEKTSAQEGSFVRKRMERLIYLGESDAVYAKYIKGRKVYEKDAGSR